MPRRPSPSSLKSKCLTEVAKNLERLSYGCEKGSPELHDLIDTEAFLQVEGGYKENREFMLVYWAHNITTFYLD